MKFTHSRSAATMAFVFAAPLMAMPAPATESGEAETVEVQSEAAGQAEISAPMPSETQESEATEAPRDEAATAKEEQRICRRVRLDAASRRGTRVCLTQAGWRDFNQRR
jgi:hypothetical protein